MNWHVLVIMQSFISHRFLFIGNFGKSLKNWLRHLTTTGFFSTWLGVAINIFTYLCSEGLFSSAGSDGAEDDRGWWLSSMLNGSPSHHPLCGTRCQRSTWEQSCVIGNFEVWSMPDVTSTWEPEERDFCSRECFQLCAGCKSLWLAMSSWAFFGCWQK